MTGRTGAWFPAAEVSDGAAASSANIGEPKARAKPETINIVRSDNKTFSRGFSAANGEHRGSCLCGSSRDRASSIRLPLRHDKASGAGLRCVSDVALIGFRGGRAEGE